MISILLSFLFVTSVQSESKLGELDNVAAKLFAFGDENNKFPVNNAAARALCGRYNQLVPHARKLINPLFLRYGANQIKQFLSANTICELYVESPKDMSLFVAEVNAKSNVMTESYQNFNNLLGYVAQGAIGHDFCNSNSSLMACYIHKWHNEINGLLSEQSQIIAEKVFQNYLKFANEYDPLPDCDWSDVPSAKYIQFKATNLNFAVGSFNCLAESQH